MTAFVLDASVTLSWLFEDEATCSLGSTNERAAVRSSWRLEVANVIAVAERRGRVTAARSAEFFAQLETLAMTVDEETAARPFTQQLKLPIDVVFVWRHKEKAAFPGETGRPVVG